MPLNDGACILEVEEPEYEFQTPVADMPLDDVTCILEVEEPEYEFQTLVVYMPPDDGFCEAGGRDVEKLVRRWLMMDIFNSF